jgi:hypothetical protein
MAKEKLQMDKQRSTRHTYKTKEEFEDLKYQNPYIEEQTIQWPKEKV